jgi:hypothetical protein
MNKAINIIFIILVFGLFSAKSLAHGHGGGHGGHGHSGGGHHRYWGGSYYGLGILGWGNGLRYPYTNYGYSAVPFGYPIYSPATKSVITYIQQPVSHNEKYPPGYWYYCLNPPGYYPELKQCPQDWIQVSPSPQ